MKPSIVSQQTFEFVFFTLKPGEMEAYRKFRVPFKATMRRFPGFQHSQVYQNLDNPLEMLDQEIWNSLEDALEADQRIQHEECFKILLSPLEKVSCTNNTRMVEEIARVGSGQSEEYLELYAYTVEPKKHDSYCKARKAFFESLVASANGFHRVRTFQSWLAPNTYFNLVYWTDEQAALETREQLKHNLTFHAFMETVNGCCLHKRYQALAA